MATCPEVHEDISGNGSKGNYGREKEWVQALYKPFRLLDFYIARNAAIKKFIEKIIEEN